MEPIALIICAILFFVFGVAAQDANPKQADRIASAALVNLAIICATLAALTLIYD